MRTRARDCLVVTEASKLVEPPCREPLQKFRRSARHVRSAHDVCFGPNQGSFCELFQCDRPFGRKSGVLRLRQVSNQRGRIALPDHILTGDHYRVVKLADERTPFRPWHAIPPQVGIHVGKLWPVGDVGEQVPDPAAGELCDYGIGEATTSSLYLRSLISRSAHEGATFPHLKLNAVAPCAETSVFPLVPCCSQCACEPASHGQRAFGGCPTCHRNH